MSTATLPKVFTEADIDAGLKEFFPGTTVRPEPKSSSASWWFIPGVLLAMFIAVGALWNSSPEAPAPIPASTPAALSVTVNHAFGMNQQVTPTAPAITKHAVKTAAKVKPAAAKKTPQASKKVAAKATVKHPAVKKTTTHLVTLPKVTGSMPKIPTLAASKPVITKSVNVAAPVVDLTVKLQHDQNNVAATPAPRSTVTPTAQGAGKTLHVNKVVQIGATPAPKPTPRPVADTPVAPKPVVKAPVASAPVVKAPVVSAPIVKVPVAAPVVKAPVAPKPIVKAPVAPVVAPVVIVPPKTSATDGTVDPGQKSDHSAVGTTGQDETSSVGSTPNGNGTTDMDVVTKVTI